MQSAARRLKADYPWTKAPLLASAPMRLIALAELSVEVSKAGEAPVILFSFSLQILSKYLSVTQHILCFFCRSKRA